MYLWDKRRKFELQNQQEDSDVVSEDVRVGNTLLRNMSQSTLPPLQLAAPPPPCVAKIFSPFFGIQSDWEDALSQPGGSSWVTVRRRGQETSIHGTLKCVKSNPLEVTGSEPFVVNKGTTSHQFLSVKDETSEYECSFIAPVGVFNRVHRKGVISMDVTEGGLGVSVCKDNVLKIWETETGNVRRTLEGHGADVYTCRFFPSGMVVLSAGADLTLKIWSAETGQCPATLRGHTGSIQDTCILDRGRNIISVSKDGTARLWDCGEMKELETLVKCGVVINSCALIPPSAISVGHPVSNMSEREVGTGGKLLLLAREDRKIQGIGISSREEIFSAALPSPGNRVIGTGLNTFAVGCQGGEIATFDLRKIVPPKQIHFATTTPVLDLLSHPRSPASKPSTDEGNKLFWAAKSDGTVVLVNPSLEDDSKKLIQLTGSDSDPIYQIKHDGNYIYTACRDGTIRKYSINHVLKLSP